MLCCRLYVVGWLIRFQQKNILFCFCFFIFFYFSGKSTYNIQPTTFPHLPPAPPRAASFARSRDTVASLVANSLPLHSTLPAMSFGVPSGMTNSGLPSAVISYEIGTTCWLSPPWDFTCATLASATVAVMLRSVIYAATPRVVDEAAHREMISECVSPLRVSINVPLIVFFVVCVCGPAVRPARRRPRQFLPAVKTHSAAVGQPRKPIAGLRYCVADKN